LNQSDFPTDDGSSGITSFKALEESREGWHPDSSAVEHLPVLQLNDDGRDGCHGPL